MNSRLMKEFRSPGSEYRGAPFWAWNGRLDKDELTRQIGVMHAMGMGGFFMHARVGLDTPYLSREWFDCVRACVDEAERRGMRAWIYDEDRWPSGAAGGLVTKNARHRMRRLLLTQSASPADLTWGGATLAAFTARIEGFNAFDVKPVTRGYRPLKLRRGEQLLVFSEEVEPPSSWYNGAAYLDTMSHAAVKEFIRVTHDAYARHEKRRFGTVIPGIFTDEPNHGGKLRQWDGNQMPWTPRLPAVFRERYGYDIIAHLPEVFFDVNGCGVTPARYHYHECTTHLFVDAFARQIGEWCDRNGILSTGHVLSEESLSGQSSVVGDCMRFYEYMQAPGMDLLMEVGREFDTAKQVSSVARQFGRRWRITETYGCTGWDFSFKHQKALSDWQAALGINLRCQHLAWYTMLGEAKRDYPASIFFQSPWWNAYPMVEDYYGRIHAVMTKGKEVRDLLVVHPVESMWLLFKKDWQDDAAKDRREYAHVALRDTILGANIDFDYGAEHILARHGRVVRRNGRPVCRVGKADYTAVVVPPMITMRPSTLALLQRFRRAGGLVVFAGDVPGHLDGSPSDAVRAFAAACVRTKAAGASLVKAIEPCRRVSITDGSGAQINPALHLLREDGHGYYLFVCNTGQVLKPFGPHQISQLRVDQRTAVFPEVNIRGFAECKGAPIELDPLTGDACRADVTRDGGELVITTSLDQLGSRLFVIPKRRQRAVPPARRRLEVIRTEKLTGAWDVTATEPNVLVLDRPAYRIGRGRPQGPREILSVDKRVRDALGIERRGGQMVQPWARVKPARPRGIAVELTYTFAVDEVPRGELFVAIERPATFRIRVNGTPMDSAAQGWWVDPSLEKVPLPSRMLKTGRNELLMTCEYSEDHPGLEIVYLLGDFGTRVRGSAVAVTKKPEKLTAGDWVTRGFAFYAGALRYRRTIGPRPRRGERLFVNVPRFRGAAVRIAVGGAPAGIIAWEPQELDITDLVGAVPCELSIEVIGHRRNSHGPLHLKDDHPAWTGPGQFDVETCESIDGYNLVPCGLLAPPSLVWKRGA